MNSDGLETPLEGLKVTVKSLISLFDTSVNAVNYINLPEEVVPTEIKMWRAAFCVRYGFRILQRTLFSDLSGKMWKTILREEKENSMIVDA